LTITSLFLIPRRVALNRSSLESQIRESLKGKNIANFRAYDVAKNTIFSLRLPRPHDKACPDTSLKGDSDKTGARSTSVCAVRGELFWSE
jgi:hypothetical protein